MAQRLKDRGVVRIGGSDAALFLHGLVTADIESLTDGGTTFGGLLAPQGKILFDFVAHRRGDAFLLDVPAEAVADLVKRLGFYRLRAAVEIDDLSAETAVVVDLGADAPADGVGIPADPRLAALGTRTLAPSAETTGDSTAAYHERRIPLGIAEAWRDYPSADVFPHEANFDYLSGVSLVKGCYVGQEVVSRMQHRGTARKRFIPCRLEGAAIELGTEITVDGRKVGRTGSAGGGYQLALLRLDRIGEVGAGNAPLTAGDSHLRPEMPAWMAQASAPVDAAE